MDQSGPTASSKKRPAAQYLSSLALRGHWDSRLSPGGRLVKAREFLQQVVKRVRGKAHPFDFVIRTVSNCFENRETTNWAALLR